MKIKTLALIVMRVITCAMALLVIATGLSPVLAEEEKTLSTTLIWQDIGWLKLRQDAKFKVRVDDGVSDGCWTNVKSVKTAIELELKRSGFEVVAEDDETALFADYIQIQSTGYGTGGTGYGTGGDSCAVSYRLEWVRMYSDELVSNGHELSNIHYISSWGNGGIMTGSKQGMNSRLKDAYVGLVQAFLNNIDQKQKEVLDAIIGRVSNEAGKDYWSKFFKSI